MKTPYPFQEKGIAFHVSRPHSGNADDMGLGKTLQAIETINRTSPDRVLIICPATIKINWMRELKEGLTGSLTVGIVNGDAWVGTDIVIINYDILDRHIEHMHAVSWDWIIADEAHYIKNLEAERTIATLGVLMRTDRRLWLTGSPILNRPVELLPLLYAIGAITEKKFWQYQVRYCNAQLKTRDRKNNLKYWDVKGQSNLIELAEKFAPWIIRRTKKEVLPDLPKKTRQIIELGGTENGLLDEWFARFKKAGDDASTAQEYAKAIQKFQYELNIEFGDFSTTRREDAMGKLDKVIPFLRDAVDASGKVVCFAHHRGFIAGLKKAFPKNSVAVVGGMSTEEKQRSIDRFISDPGIGLLLGNIKAAGQGVDGLQKVCSHAIFAELEWSPKVVEQAEDRICRIGQTKPALIQHLVVDNTMDVLMAKVLLGKLYVIERAGLG